MPKRGGENLQIKKRANLRSLSSSFASLELFSVGGHQGNGTVVGHFLCFSVLVRSGAG